MLESNKKINEINEWTFKIEGDYERHGQFLEKLQKLLNEVQTADKLEKIREQESKEEQIKRKRYGIELEIEEIKLKIKIEYEKKNKSNSEKEQTYLK